MRRACAVADQRAVGAEGQRHRRRPARQKRGRERARLSARLPQQAARLVQIEEQAGHAGQVRRETPRLRRRDRVEREARAPGAGQPDQPLQRGGGRIAIGKDPGALGQARLQRGGQLAIGLVQHGHVGHRHRQRPVRAQDRHILRGSGSGAPEHAVRVHAQRGQVSDQRRSVRVVAHGRDQSRPAPQPRQVFRHVAGDAAEGRDAAPRIRGRRARRLGQPELAVDGGAADAEDGGSMGRESGRHGWTILEPASRR